MIATIYFYERQYGINARLNTFTIILRNEKRKQDRYCVQNSQMILSKISFTLDWRQV